MPTDSIVYDVEKCRRSIDILVMMDESCSVSDTEWEEAKTFIDNFAVIMNNGRKGRQIGSNSNKVRIAVMGWSSSDMTAIRVPFSASAGGLSAWQQSLAGYTSRYCGITCIGTAVQWATTNIMNARSPTIMANRKGLSEVIVIITDGYPSDVSSCSSTSAARVAAFAALNGAVDKVLPVGVGSGIGTAVLEAYAHPAGEGYITTTYANMDVILNELAYKSCIPKPTKAPTGPPTRAPTKWPTKAPTTKMPTNVPTAKPTPGGCTTAEKLACGDDGTAASGNPQSLCTCANAACSVKKCGCAAPWACQNAACQLCTISPTTAPTKIPTQHPTIAPTTFPTLAPTEDPTSSPTKMPTAKPSVSPTVIPTMSPTYSNVCTEAERTAKCHATLGLCSKTTVGAIVCTCAAGYGCAGTNCKCVTIVC